jgi:ABC-type uncharacterized transport system
LCIALVACSGAPPQPKRELGVMSALPLFWREGDVADALAPGEQRAPIIQALAADFRVTPLDILSAATLRPFKLLMLAQPRTLSPEELAAVDIWVRSGGRLVVFADPLLGWPSRYPFGDRRRAPPVTLLDPLFGHWGLAMTAAADEPGLAVVRALNGTRVATQSVGRWTVQGNACTIRDNGFRARCRIGKGVADLVADADLLDLDLGKSQNVDNGKAIVELLTGLSSEISESFPRHPLLNTEQEKNNLIM